MEIMDMEAIIIDSLETIKGRGPYDRRLPLAFVQLVMALWLVDMTQFPAYFSIMLADLSENPVLEGQLDTIAVEAFGHWVTKMTTSREEHYVLGAGAFKQKFAALMARARVAGLEQGAALAKFLRKEVLTANRGQGEASSSLRVAARPSALTSHISTKIHDLGVVLTTICEVMESRVAELTKSGAWAGVGVVAPASSQSGCPVVAGGEKVGTTAPSSVTAATGAEEKGLGVREEIGTGTDGGGDVEQQRDGGAGGAVGGHSVAGTPTAVAVTVAAVTSEPRASSSPTYRRDASAQRGGNDEPGGDMSTLILAQLSQLHQMVSRGFSNLGAQQENLKAGQVKLEEEFGRLRSSLLPSSTDSAGGHTSDVVVGGRRPPTGAKDSRLTVLASGSGAVKEAFADTTPSAAADDAAAAVGIDSPAGDAAAAAAASAPSRNSSGLAAARAAATTSEAGAGLAATAKASTASAASPAAAPAPERQDQKGVPIAQQIFEISARLDRLFVLPGTGTGTAEETPPRQRAPASTIGQTFQAANPEGSVASSAPAVPPVVERDAARADAPAGGGEREERERGGFEGTETVEMFPAFQETQQEIPGCGCCTKATREASIAGSHAALKVEDEEEKEKDVGKMETNERAIGGARGSKSPLAGSRAALKEKYEEETGEDVGKMETNEPAIGGAGGSKSPLFGRVPIRPDRNRPAGAKRTPAPAAKGGEDTTGCGRYSDISSTTQGQHSKAVEVVPGFGKRTTGARGGAATGETAAGVDGDGSSVPVSLTTNADTKRPLEEADSAKGNAQVVDERGGLGGMEQNSGKTQLAKATAGVRACLIEVDGPHAEAVDEPTREMLFKTTRGASISVPTTACGPTPSPASMVEVVAGVWTRTVVDGGEKEEVDSGTVPAASGSSGIKLKQISEDERAMPGAPQGEIFEVKVLESSELSASGNVPKEMEVIRTPFAAEDWAFLFRAVSSARTLLAYHSEVFEGREGGDCGLLSMTVSLAACAASSRRSVVQTNGLRCLAELFRTTEVGKKLSAEEMRTLVAAAGACQKSPKAFTRKDSDKAMDTAVANANPALLLDAILPQALDAHPKVASQAVIYAEKCLSRLGAGDVVGSGLADGLDMRSLSLALAKGAASKVPGAKDAAWRAVERCQSALGASAFETTVAEHAGKRGARAILDLVFAKTRQRARALVGAAAAASAGTTPVTRTGLSSRRRVAGGGGGARSAALGFTTGWRGRGTTSSGDNGVWKTRVGACVMEPERIRTSPSPVTGEGKAEQEAAAAAAATAGACATRVLEISPIVAT